MSTKHDTPKFVQHCVSAIVNDPTRLRKLKTSPFAICNAVYEKNKRVLAARHATGKHHSIKEFEKALALLKARTKEMRESRAPRHSVLFVESKQPQIPRHDQIVFKPVV